MPPATCAAYSVVRPVPMQKFPESRYGVRRQGRKAASSLGPNIQAAQPNRERLLQDENPLHLFPETCPFEARLNYLRDAFRARSTQFQRYPWPWLTALLSSISALTLSPPVRVYRKMPRLQSVGSCIDAENRAKIAPHMQQEESSCQ